VNLPRDRSGRVRPTTADLRYGAGEFGFLESNDGQEVYFHRNSVLGDGFSRLHVGSRVTFAEEMGEKCALPR
jgi:cold shock CspA family protein